MAWLYRWMADSTLTLAFKILREDFHEADGTHWKDR
jgi:hypothetical protein